MPIRIRNVFLLLISAPNLLLSSWTIAQERSHEAHGAAAQSASSSVLSSETAGGSHRFWDRANLLLFSGIAVSRTLDYTSTRNMLARGRQEILIPDDVVYNRAGFPALEVAGAATSIGISYLLHRTGHHRWERLLSIGHIGVTDFGAVRNYSLESRRR